MRPSIVTAAFVALACVGASSAHADRWTPRQVDTAMNVADNHWAWSPCYHAHIITWTDDIPEPQTLAIADVGGCRVTVDWRRIGDIIVLCSVLEHEYGHNAGLEHSTDPHDIMYADQIIAPDCWAAFTVHHHRKHRHV